MGAIQKWVENRIWRTNFRGTFAIHSGRSLKWFKGGDWPVVPRKPSDVPEMAFGAIVGVADLVMCLDENTGAEWIATHHHATGPFLWVLANVYRLEQPVPVTGKLGFWTVPTDVERQVNEQRKIFISGNY